MAQDTDDSTPQTFLSSGHGGITVASTSTRCARNWNWGLICIPLSSLGLDIQLSTSTLALYSLASICLQIRLLVHTSTHINTGAAKSSLDPKHCHSGLLPVTLQHPSHQPRQQPPRPSSVPPRHAHLASACANYSTPQVTSVILVFYWE